MVLANGVPDTALMVNQISFESKYLVIAVDTRDMADLRAVVGYLPERFADDLKGF